MSKLKYITHFAASARNFARLCRGVVNDYIIWNEFNVGGTAFVPNVAAPGALDLNADHFAALIYQCIRQFNEEFGEGDDRPNIYWGGIFVPATDTADLTINRNADITNMEQNLRAVYAAFARAWDAGIERPARGWQGINLHLHHSRGWNSAATDIALQQATAYMSALFDAARGVMSDEAVNDTDSEIIVGETGVTDDEFLQNATSIRILLQSLWDSRPFFANTVFYLSHHHYADPSPSPDVWGVTYPVADNNRITPDGPALQRDAYVNQMDQMTGSEQA